MAARILENDTMTTTRSTPGSARRPEAEWALVRDRLHERGLRWTPQRRTLVEVLSRTDGHVTGSELVERCREIDPETTPSTVYRTLDVLEELGLVRHGHGADGREEFHVLPRTEHGHLYCSSCGGTWEIGADEARALVGPLEASRGFIVDLSHVTIVGRCASCR
jgi:Fur family ferric uptake transcriptional regulator